MKICSESDCDRPNYSNGLCSMHYKREWRARTPGFLTGRELDHNDGFWDVVDGYTRERFLSLGFRKEHATVKQGTLSRTTREVLEYWAYE